MHKTYSEDRSAANDLYEDLYEKMMQTLADPTKTVSKDLLDSIDKQSKIVSTTVDSSSDTLSSVVGSSYSNTNSKKPKFYYRVESIDYALDHGMEFHPIAAILEGSKGIGLPSPSQVSFTNHKGVNAATFNNATDKKLYDFHKT